MKVSQIGGELTADHIRRAFLLWLQRARRSRDLTQKSEFLQKEWEDRLKAETFVRWYDLKRERDLQTTVSTDGCQT